MAILRINSSVEVDCDVVEEVAWEVTMVVITGVTTEVTILVCWPEDEGGAAGVAPASDVDGGVDVATDVAVVDVRPMISCSSSDISSGTSIFSLFKREFTSFDILFKIEGNGNKQLLFPM